MSSSSSSAPDTSLPSEYQRFLPLLQVLRSAGWLHQRHWSVDPWGWGLWEGGKERSHGGALCHGSSTPIGANHWLWGCGIGTLTCLLLAAWVSCGTQGWHPWLPARCGRAAVLAGPQPGSLPPPRFLSLRFPSVFCCTPSSGCCWSSHGLAQVAGSAIHFGAGELLWCEALWQHGWCCTNCSLVDEQHSQCLQSALVVRQRTHVSMKQACGLLAIRLIAAGSSCVCADREPGCGVLVRSALVPQLRGCPRAPVWHGAHAPSLWHRWLCSVTVWSGSALASGNAQLL